MSRTCCLRATTWLCCWKFKPGPPVWRQLYYLLAYFSKLKFNVHSSIQEESNFFQLNLALWSCMLPLPSGLSDKDAAWSAKTFVPYHITSQKTMTCIVDDHVIITA